MSANTVFLRLEGLLQAWGDTSKFVIRRTMEAPTKSGVLGLVCCAMGLSRRKASERLSELNGLALGVRIDRPGMRWWDWHTVGAGIGILTADGKIKKTQKTRECETLVTRREYLADASFLVALQGKPSLVEEIADALQFPRWPIFLGRKSCPPSRPILTKPRKGESWSNPGQWENLDAALGAVPWYPRTEAERTKGYKILDCLVEWRAEGDEDAPREAEVWYDTPFSFDPPVHHPRLVLHRQVRVSVADAIQSPVPPPPRPRADYTNSEYRAKRAERLEADASLCVFCKAPATTVQHVTYRRAGGGETLDDLRSLCRLCHDAVTMIEYGLGMGLDRIDPTDPRWRDDILRTRREILEWRNEEHRRRALRKAPPEVQAELLEKED